jgi:hypothetical protein
VTHCMVKSSAREMPEEPSSADTGRPAWVKAAAIVALVLAVLAVLVLVAGPGEHGPGRHAPGGDTREGHTRPPPGLS